MSIDEFPKKNKTPDTKKDLLKPEEFQQVIDYLKTHSNEALAVFDRIKKETNSPSLEGESLAEYALRLGLPKIVDLKDFIPWGPGGLNHQGWAVKYKNGSIEHYFQYDLAGLKVNPKNPPIGLLYLGGPVL